jgi:hypothetical protein
MRITSFQVESFNHEYQDVRTICMKVEAEELLTTAELAQRMKVNPATIRGYFAEGMPGEKRSYRLIVFKLSECENWLRKREEQKEKARQQRAREREEGARKRKI